MMCLDMATDAQLIYKAESEVKKTGKNVTNAAATR